MGFKILSFFNSSEPVVADVASILDSLKHIKQATIDFDTCINSWDGGILGAFSLVKRANDVITDTNNTATLAKTAAPFAHDEAKQIIDLIQDIADVVGKVVDTVDTDQAKFKRVKYIGDTAAIAILRRLKYTIEAMADAFVPKTPAEILPITDSIAEQFDRHLARGIAIFETSGAGHGEGKEVNEEKVPTDLSSTVEIAQVKA
ncbi:hypothetical protein PT974_09870 [Cladobotryum mycophilum]|uniref:Uncharacterized protein n=1 Tax=Cladobotryum mycophilum TaxID=491253 RepID=A0ABR0SHH0_9HYPO